MKGYGQKYEEENADDIKEREKQYRESEKGKATIQANRPKVYHCEEVSRREIFQPSIFLAENLNGEKLERPDVLWFRCFKCFKCKKKEIYFAWSDHVSSEKTYQELLRG